LALWEAAERVDAPLERARAHERYMRPEAFAAVAVFNGATSYGNRPSTAFSATPRRASPTWRGGDTPAVFSAALADKGGMKVFTLRPL